MGESFVTFAITIQRPMPRIGRLFQLVSEHRSSRKIQRLGRVCFNSAQRWLPTKTEPSLGCLVRRQVHPLVCRLHLTLLRSASAPIVQTNHSSTDGCHRSRKWSQLGNLIARTKSQKERLTASTRI